MDIFLIVTMIVFYLITIFFAYNTGYLIGRRDEIKEYLKRQKEEHEQWRVE